MIPPKEYQIEEPTYRCVCGASPISLGGFLRYIRCYQCNLIWDREQGNYLPVIDEDDDIDD